MKALAVSVILFVLGFQVVYPVVFTAWFFANQQAIAKRYCVNKKRPSLHCDGKCFLAQKIKAAEERNQPEQTGVMRNIWVESPPCILEESAVFCVLPGADNYGHWPYWVTPLRSTMLPGIDRPPAIQG